MQKHDKPQDKSNTNILHKKYSLGTISKNILLEGLNRSYNFDCDLATQIVQHCYKCINKKVKVDIKADGHHFIFIDT